MRNPRDSSPQDTDARPHSADPAVREHPTEDSFRPFGAPRWLGILLYAFFWVILLLPRLRRLRRRAHWNRVRAVTALAGASLVAGAWIGDTLWLGVTGGIVVFAALVVTRTQDPDRERKIQARHGADYLLNGGVLVRGTLPGSSPSSELPGPNENLYLLIRGRDLLVVPANGPGDIISTIDIRQVTEILVAGEPYLPVYVSEAKDPPVRETSAMTGYKTELQLTLEPDQTLCFQYQGAFSKHLAETTAHAIYSIRGLLQEVESSNTQPLFEIVG